MIEIVSVWVLMTSATPYGGSPSIHYSPPIATLADCERLKTAVYTGVSRCVQINMVIKK